MIGIKIAYYRKKDWNRFINMIDDKESMHDTWREWHKAFEKGKRDLINQGFEVEDVIVNLDELSEYCKLRGIKNDGKARSAFVQEK
jgi:predicted ATPase